LEIVRLVVGLNDRNVRGYDCDRETMDAAYVVESNVKAIKVEKYILQHKILLVINLKSKAIDMERKSSTRYLAIDFIAPEAKLRH
jgi:hypothetical protein